ANRRALPTNGYFGQTISSSGSMVSPITLGANHAQVWTASDQIFIKDTDSPFGTFINDERLDSGTSRALKTGDILRLGIQLTRSSNTPENVTDEQLRPIIAK
ncbi:hypothetical protein K435DRAFT_575871, partial [Dendrothele bispora CBS 962.96]